MTEKELYVLLSKAVNIRRKWFPYSNWIGSEICEHYKKLQIIRNFPQEAIIDECKTILAGAAA